MVSVFVSDLRRSQNKMKTRICDLAKIFTLLVLMLLSLHAIGNGIRWLKCLLARLDGTGIPPSLFPCKIPNSFRIPFPMFLF